MHPTLTRPRPAPQRGVSMLEALIAALLLAIGMLALSRLQIDLRASADAARERSEAVRLAQIDIEHLRVFADGTAWSAVVDASGDVTPAGSTTVYMLERTVQTRADPDLKAVQVTVHWTDRHGAAQQLRLDTLIAGQDPVVSGALALPRPPIGNP